MRNHAFLGPALAAALVLSLTSFGAAGAQEAPSCGSDTATIVGTQGPDVLKGTPGHDTIAGLGGNDVIRGFGGSDLICGGDGDDRLYGGDTNQDRLYGGEGNDLLDAGRGVDHLYGEDGNDRLLGAADDGTVEGGSGDDVYEGVKAQFATSPAPIEVDLGAGIATGDGTDTLIGVSEVRGSLFDDLLEGDDLDNDLLGAQGNDIIDGRGGDDHVNGGPGRDRSTGGDGNDSFSEIDDSGDDVLDGGPGTDSVDVSTRYVSGQGYRSVHIDLSEGTATGSGHDTLTSIENAQGGSGSNTLIGTDGANELRGGGEDDVIYGHGGDDLIDLDYAQEEDFADGGTGDDRFVPADLGTSVIEGGDGIDLMSFGKWFDSPGGVIVDLLQGVFVPAHDATGGDGRVSGIENVIGSPHPDVIRGDGAPNKLVGRGDNDRLAGRGGPDLLIGGKGADKVSGGPGVDVCRSESYRGCEG